MPKDLSILEKEDQQTILQFFHSIIANMKTEIDSTDDSITPLDILNTILDAIKKASTDIHS